MSRLVTNIEIWNLSIKAQKVIEKEKEIAKIINPILESAANNGQRDVKIDKQQLKNLLPKDVKTALERQGFSVTIEDRMNRDNYDHYSEFAYLYVTW